MKKLKVRLRKIDLKNNSELIWLHRFIRKNHSSPKNVLPSRQDLKNPDHVYFRAFGKAPGSGNELLVGITSYEIRTRFLVETQKTIVLPELRGHGWGKAISSAIEEQVRKAGFRKVRSTIYSDNLTMIGIKLAQGYRIEGFHPDHEAPGLHEYSLGKFLRAGKDA